MNSNLSYYRSELKSKHVAKYKLIGITTELILDKSLFKNNKDLTPFLKDIYNLSFKKYVIKSRTTMLSRTLREIYKHDGRELEILRKNLLNFLNAKLEISSAQSKYKNTSSDFTKWMEGITNADS